METVATKKLDRFVQSLSKTRIPFPSTQTEKAEELIALSDFPTTRDEAWKYTRVGKIAGIAAKEDHTQFSDLELSELAISKEHHTVILCNGKATILNPEKAQASGVEIIKLSECSREEITTFRNSENSKDIFDALNVLYLNEGLVIKVADKTIVKEPLTMIHVITGEESVHHSRLFLSLGKHSQLEVIQQFVSIGNSSYSHNITELQLADGANLNWHKLQLGLGSNFLISREVGTQSANSRFTLHTHTVDSGFVRNDSTMRVTGQNAETNLYGTYLLKGSEHVDNHTIIDHIAPNCLSNELYKGVIGDKATGVFNGKVFVRPDAQKINAFQSNANILTSDQASMNSKPELEIYADDVKCSHGSTTGQLDDEAVFYLRARGISERSAKDLMIRAFLEDVLEKTENEMVKNKVEEGVNNFFNASED